MEQYQADMERGLATFMDLAEVGFVCTCVLCVLCLYVGVVCVRVCVVCTYVCCVCTCVLCVYVCVLCGCPVYCTTPRPVTTRSVPCIHPMLPGSLPPPPLNPCPRTPSVCHTSP
jgi:hypothetical protein